MHTPNIQNLARPRGGKIVWVSCNDFDSPTEQNFKKNVLESAWTPNIDQLCAFSETGLMKWPSASGAPADFEDITRMRALVLTNETQDLPLQGLFKFEHYEVFRSLAECETILEANWNEYDLFYIELDDICRAVRTECEASHREWIELLDAWLPGLFSRFDPEVFALSGEGCSKPDAETSSKDSVPVLMHSKRSRARQTEGFCRGACRKGGLGDHLELREWLLLLMAHANRLNEASMSPKSEEAHANSDQSS